MKINRIAVLVALLATLLGATPIFSAQAITMSPIRLELAADPGSHTNGVVKVFNDQNKEQTYYLSAANFESKDETGQPSFVPSKDGLASWINLQNSIVVPPHEAKEVTFSVNVPSNVDPGGYYAAIFASLIPPDPTGNQIALQNDVGTLVLFRVNGQFPEGETILEFNTKDKQHILNHLPVEFYFRFQNSGKDRVQPLGDITIHNMFGSVAKVVSANKGAGNVLPQSIRRYDTAWVTSGKGKDETQFGEIKQPEFKNFFDAVKYQWDNFALGRYSADLKVVVNNDASRQYQKAISFWIIPWQLLVVIAGILILFVAPLISLLTVIMVYLRRRR